MKIGDFVKIDHKYMSPLTAKRYNNNPMGLVIWTSNKLTKPSAPQGWSKVRLMDGRELSFPWYCMEVINENR